MLLVGADVDAVREFAATFLDNACEIVVAGGVDQVGTALDAVDDLTLAIIDVAARDSPELFERLGREFPDAQLMVRLDARSAHQTLTDTAAASNGAQRRARAYAMHLQTRHGLTDRQLDILVLAILGRTNDEIARDLAISINTVKVHIRDILRATGANRLAELAREYWRAQSE